MPVSLDTEAADTPVAVQLVEVAAIPAQRQIDISPAHHGRAAIGVDQRDGAIVVDRKARDRTALCIRGIAVLAVLGDYRPAGCALMSRHRAARDTQRASAANHIRRGTSRRLGNEQLIAMTEGEPKWRAACRC